MCQNVFCTLPACGVDSCISGGFGNCIGNDGQNAGISENYDSRVYDLCGCGRFWTDSADFL